MKAHGLVRFCLPAVLCLGAWGLLRYPEQTADAVREGIQLCLNQIIPSLYGFLILTGVLLRTGLHQRLGGLFRPFARHVLHMTEGEFSIFLCSQLAGYPVGVQMLSELVRQGEIPPRRAARLAGICFGSGPAFVLSLVGTCLYPHTPAGSLLLVSGILGNLILAILLRQDKPNCHSAPAAVRMPW